MRSALLKSEARALSTSGRIILVVTILGALAGWLSLPPGYLNIPEFRRFVGLAPVISNPRVTSSPELSDAQRPGLPIVTAKAEVRPAEDSTQLPYVGGLWRSSSRFAYTYFFTQSGDSFDIYQDDPTAGHVKVGSGRVVKDGVAATVRTIKEQRWAIVSLRLSPDGQTLEGTFSGTASRERSFALRLTRVK